MELDSIKIAVVRRTVPMMLASEIVDVQPIEMPTFETVTSRDIGIHVCDDSCDSGQWVHYFAYGWKKEINCPLYHGKPNIVGYEVTSGGNLFNTKSIEDCGFHLNCEIPNMRFI